MLQTITILAGLVVSVVAIGLILQRGLKGKGSGKRASVQGGAGTPPPPEREE